MKHPRVYLSPSKQPNNIYASGSTNEEKEMVEVSKLLQKILQEDYGIEVVLADLQLDIGKNGRPKEAKNKGCSIYLAIHSNAGGGGKAKGAVALIHPQSKESRALGKLLVEELDGISPFGSNRGQSIVDGMKAFNGKGYGEVRTPYEFGLTPVLMETNFHDHIEIAKWMTGSKEDIARAYGRAVSRFLKVEKAARKDAAESTGKDGSKETPLYRVQVGAFRKIENAEELKTKLWNLGFESFISFR